MDPREVTVPNPESPTAAVVPGPAPPNRRLDRSLANSLAWRAAANWSSQIFSWASFLLTVRFLSPSANALNEANAGDDAECVAPIWAPRWKTRLDAIPEGDPSNGKAERQRETDGPAKDQTGAPGPRHHLDVHAVLVAGIGQ